MVNFVWKFIHSVLSELHLLHDNVAKSNDHLDKKKSQKQLVFLATGRKTTVHWLKGGGGAIGKEQRGGNNTINTRCCVRVGQATEVVSWVNSSLYCLSTRGTLRDTES